MNAKPELTLVVSNPAPKPRPDPRAYHADHLLTQAAGLLSQAHEWGTFFRLEAKAGDWTHALHCLREALRTAAEAEAKLWAAQAPLATLSEGQGAPLREASAWLRDSLAEVQALESTAFVEGHIRLYPH